MIARFFTLVGVLGCLGLSVGCAGQPRVTVITSTMVGLEAKPPMGDGQPNPSVNFGYKRVEMALVPVCRVAEYSWWKTFKESLGLKDENAQTGQNTPCPPKASSGADSYAVLGSFQMAHNWFGPLNIRQFIATGMAARHLITPTVHVIGEVKNPGRQPFTKDLTVKQAIDMAGGPTDQASPDPATILRQSNANQNTVEGKADTGLMPDDILNVPKAHWFHISGEVNNPGRYLYEEGLTIDTALSLAGGLMDKKKQGKIKATQVKKTDRSSETRELGAKAAVLPDDIIVVEPPPQVGDQDTKKDSASDGAKQEKNVGSEQKDRNTDASKTADKPGKDSEKK